MARCDTFTDPGHALSRESDFCVGCYCEDESHCHRSILRSLLAAKGARIAPGQGRQKKEMP